MHSTISWLVEFISRQRVPLAIACLILLPSLTYYISTTLFFRKARTKNATKTPPVVPFLIPGLYHSIGLISRPAIYFANYIQEYGSYGPFTVKAGRQSYVVLRDPNHVRKMFASDHLTTNFVRQEMFDKVFGIPKSCLEVYKGLDAKKDEFEQLQHASLTLPRKYLVGSSLISLADIYVSTLRRNMSNKMFQTETWTQIEDLSSFFELEITRAVAETLFGSALIKQYPKIAQDFWKLETNIQHFLPGLPRLTVSGVYGIRDRLLENFKKWLQATHGGTDFGKIGQDDPVWDESRGSKYVQERDTVLAGMPSFNYQARAAEMLGMLYSSTSTTVPSIFWSLVEVLQHPDLEKYLSSQITRYYNPESGGYNIEAIFQIPVINSVNAEVDRLRLATRSILTVQGESIRLDDNWILPKGSSAIVFAQDMGLNITEWTRARSQTAMRPLEEFWPERFLVPDGSASRREPKRRDGNIGSGRFSLEHLDSLLLPGGGANLHPEISFSNAIRAVTLAFFLNDFEVQLCDPEYMKHIVPPLQEAAFGANRPLDKVAVRIRKRRHGQKKS